MEKIGVYICSSCDIGERLNLDDLAQVANQYNPAVCKTLPFLCGQEAVETIKGDISSEGLDSVVICACSPRVNYDVFDFGAVPVERVNLREGVVWSRPAPAEGEWDNEYVSFEDELMNLAKDYVRMGVVKMQKYAPPEPYKPEEEISETIMVMGGGVTGLTAALEAAKAGKEVVLVEKNSDLGGYVAKMKKMLQPNPPFTELEEPITNKLISEVNSNPNIKVYTGTTVTKISGAPGLYSVELSNGQTERIGTIVVATGWKPYDASKLEEPYGFGKYANVITNFMYEEMAAKGEIKRPSDGKPAKSVVFIQCAGQRDENHLPYCSSFCCLASLKHARYLREQDSDARAYIIYKDMRTMGIYENFYKSLQDDPGVFLTKGEIGSISEAGDGGLTVEVKNTLIGEDLTIEADLVVLATGIEPTTKDDPIIPLEYRQGPGFPEIELFYGYADSNYICFPYETRRTGIYTAGCVHQPMTAGMAMDDAAGAVLKAIQCLEAIKVGRAVHPRTWDYAYPEFYFKRCTQCKRCTEECPFGALDDDEAGTPKPNPTRCRRCGTCFGACPERIISFKDFSIDMVGSMIKAWEMPEPEYGQFRILAFVCENDALPALDMAAMYKQNIPVEIRFIPVRCLGSVNVAWIKDALSTGTDGVILIGCRYGENYQCHFIKGSELANRRMENVGETLQQLALESERVQLVQVAIDEYFKIPKILQDFVATIKELGENPFKGF
ncbi:FAD-dependent oxidoreductase [Thermosulfuriphilus sp.]